MESSMKVLDVVEYVLKRQSIWVYLWLTILFIVIIITIKISFYETKPFINTEDTKTSNKDSKVAKYIGKCIIDSFKNMDLVVKCQYLIKKYPQVINFPEKHSNITPFLIACHYGNENIVSLMLENGADVNSVSSKNYSTIYLATLAVLKKRTKNFNILEMLIHAGAPINRPSIDGNTPLMLAAIFGYDDLVKYLLTHGADPTIKKNNTTPWKMALKTGHETTAGLLFIDPETTK